MEVHHHAHTDPAHSGTNTKKFTNHLWEFLMLFLAVTLGFYAENIREGIIHKEQVRMNMQSLLNDLRSDVALFDSVIERNQYSYSMADSLIELLHSDITNTREIYFTARGVTANVGYYYSNSKSFDQLKSSGLLRFINPKDLSDSIGNYYVSFQWLANQTDLMRLKLDEVHKGNNILFDSYVFYQMMKTLAVNTFSMQHIVVNKPEGHPALLSTSFKDLNTVSLNYHYYSATSKFYNHTAVIQRQRAAQLIELIKKEYNFE